MSTVNSVPSPIDRSLIHFATVLVAALLVGATVPAPTAAQTVIYVDDDASGAEDGSRSDPYTNLQAALSDASGTSGAVEIRMSSGVYYPDEGSGVTDGDTTATFSLSADLTVKGGYTSDFSSRDPAANVTVLSGDVDQDDATNSDGIVTDTADVSGSNSVHVVEANNLSTAATLDGLTITAGQADAKDPDFGETTDQGGGIFVSESDLTLQNVEVVGNFAYEYGGGVRTRTSGKLTVENSTLRANAGKRGGAVNTTEPLEMRRVTVRNNVANRGGGVNHSDGDQITLENVTFTGNKAIESGEGGAETGNGGGLYVSGFASQQFLVMRSVTFKNNTTEFLGIGDPIDSQGGGAYLNVESPKLVNVTFRGNTVSETDGGGLFIDTQSGGVLRDGLFENNAASTPEDDVTKSDGGAMVISNSLTETMTVANTTFRDNSADGNGGAVKAGGSVTFEDLLFKRNEASVDGGGISIDGTDWVIRNVVFRNNTAGGAGTTLGGGGGLAGELSSIDDSPSALLENVRFENNRSYDGGGGMLGVGGILEMKNVDFVENVAVSDFGGRGSALLSDRAKVKLANAEVRGNEGTSGTIEVLDEGTIQLTNVLLADNTQPSDFAGTGVVKSTGGAATLNNVVVASNGVTGLVNSDTMTVHNSIVYGNEGLSDIDEINNQEGSSLDVQNTLVRDSLDGQYVRNEGTINDNGGNISGDPMFADTSNGDYHLQSGSPAVDAGNDSLIPDDSLDLDADGDSSEAVPVDLDLRARTENTVDMGPYELGGALPQYTASLSSGDTDAGVPSRFNLDLTFQTLSTSTDLTLTYDPAPPSDGLNLPDNQALAITSLWDVEFDPVPSSSDIDATLCFALEDLVLPSLDPSELNVYARSSPDASDWQERTPTELRPSDTPEQVCVTGQSSFSQFAVTANELTFDQTPPDAPSNLVTSVSVDNVSLSWTGSDSSDVARYRIYRDTAPISGEPSGLSPYDSTSIDGQAPTTFVDEGVTTNQTYYYRVTAVDSASNESSFSGESEATPGTPDPPTGLAASVSVDTVNLEWNESGADDAVQYHIYRDTAPIDSSAGPGSLAALDTTSVGTTAYVDTTATLGTTHYYRVTVEDTAANESGFSGEAQARPQAPAPPPPTDLTASPQSDSVSLAWTASSGSDVARYAVYRDTAPIDSSAGPSALTPIDSTAAGTTSFVDSDAAAGNTYYYRVTAIDSEGSESDFSGEARAFLYPQEVSAAVDRSFGGATDSTDYRLVALPGQAGQPLADAIEGEAGADWQAYYDDGSQEDYLVRFDGSAPFTFEAGNGFWLTATDNWTSSVQTQTVALQGDTAATIPLRSGWNVISNPLDKNVAWSRVNAQTPGDLQAIYGFDGTFSEADTFRSAKAGVAYYFFNGDAGRSELVIPYPGAPREKTAPAPEGEEASLLALSARPAEPEGAPRSTVKMGLAEEADPGLGPEDLVAPPGRFAETSLRIEPPGEPLSKRARFLITERRPAEGGQTFTLRLTHRDEGPVRLHASGLEALGDRSARLLRPAAGTSHDLAAGEPITVAPEGETTELKVAVGPERYVEEKSEAVRPEEVRLTTYPNPMGRQGTLEYALPEAATVTLRVYDVLGREVATLTQGRKDAGRHTARLDTDRLSSGVYFGRLQTESKTLTQKITVVR